MTGSRPFSARPHARRCLAPSARACSRPLATGDGYSRPVATARVQRCLRPGCYDYGAQAPGSGSERDSALATMDDLLVIYLRKCNKSAGRGHITSPWPWGAPSGESACIDRGTSFPHVDAALGAIMGRLVSAARKNNSEAMFKAIRNDLACRCEATDSTRDYAALVKSLIDVTDKLGRMAGQITDGRKSGSTKSHHTSPLDQSRARRNLKVVDG